MDSSIRIDETYGSNGIDQARQANVCRQCYFYKDEICSSPRLRFQVCRSCYRIDPRLAVKSLLEKIKQLAVQYFKGASAAAARLPD